MCVLDRILFHYDEERERKETNQNAIPLIGLEGRIGLDKEGEDRIGWGREGRRE